MPELDGRRRSGGRRSRGRLGGRAGGKTGRRLAAKGQRGSQDWATATAKSRQRGQMHGQAKKEYHVTRTRWQATGQKDRHAWPPGRRSLQAASSLCKVIVSPPLHTV